ncbi:MAG TPA: hypothetical protein VKE74_21345 [Gemmataceae bacterium]|nr:hypothetical protein [Gemmataceae bacterium]
MVQFELEADVPESRQVTVTLPPEVPTGRARLVLSVEPCAGDTGTLPRLKALLPEHDPGVVYSGQVIVYDRGGPK